MTTSLTRPATGNLVAGWAYRFPLGSGRAVTGWFVRADEHAITLIDRTDHVQKRVSGVDAGSIELVSVCSPADEAATEPWE